MQRRITLWRWDWLTGHLPRDTPPCRRRIAAYIPCKWLARTHDMTAHMEAPVPLWQSSKSSLGSTLTILHNVGHAFRRASHCGVDMFVSKCPSYLDFSARTLCPCYLRHHEVASVSAYCVHNVLNFFDFFKQKFWLYLTYNVIVSC